MPIKGCAVAALVFAVFSALLTCVLIAFNKIRQLKSSAVTLMGIYRVRIKKIAEILCTPVYLTFIIISSCAMGIISATDEGTGLITSGVGVILLLVFACLAFVLAIACAAADRFIILKNFPQFEKIPERKPVELSGIAPQKVEKPVKSTEIQRAQRIFSFYTAAILVSPIGLGLQILLLNKCIYAWSGYIIILYWGIHVIIQTIGILSSPIFTKNKFTKNKFPARINLVLSLIFPFLTCVYFYLIVDLEIFTNPSSFILLPIINLIISIVALVAVQKFNKFLYDVLRPKKDAGLTLSAKNLQEQYNIYLVDLKSYKQYNLAKSMCAEGYNYYNGKERKIFWVHAHKLLSALIAVIVSAAIVLAVVLPVTLPAPEPHDLDGTYYVYRSNKYEKDNYIVINGNHWEDDDGVNGQLERSGNNLSFKSIMLGVEDEVYSGVRVGEGVLMLKIFGADIYFCMDGKTPPESSATAYYFTLSAKRQAVV